MPIRATISGNLIFVLADIGLSYLKSFTYHVSSGHEIRSLKMVETGCPEEDDVSKRIML